MVVPSLMRKPRRNVDLSRQGMASAMPCLFDDKAGFPLPALFTRSCCFHHSLSTTSSATRATKSLQSLLILAEKAGVGGSTPSLATTFQSTYVKPEIFRQSALSPLFFQRDSVRFLA